MREIEYKGFKIKIKSNNDKEYPFIAECQMGNEKLPSKRGFSEQQAIDLMKNIIDFTLFNNK